MHSFPYSLVEILYVELLAPYENVIDQRANIYFFLLLNKHSSVLIEVNTSRNADVKNALKMSLNYSLCLLKMINLQINFHLISR